MPGSSSWIPYAPQGVRGLDDDDYNTAYQPRNCSQFFKCL